MAYAERTYTSASGTEFALTNSDSKQIFFIKESDISVYVNDTEWTNAASGTSTYTISTDKTKVVLNSTVSSAKVFLQRVTAIQDPTVTYTAGSTLTATDLNNADNQIRYGLQEFSDKYAALISTTGNLPTAFASFLAGADTWVSNDNRAATSLAIDNRVDSKIDTALTTDVSGGDGVTITDNSPGAGQIRVDLDADIATLRNMQSGAASALAALTATELQIIDGATLSTTELNYVKDVTSAIQTQLNSKQALDATLTALAGVTSAADKVPYFTGSDTANVTGLTAFGRSLIDDANATAARTTLGAQVQNDILDDLAGLTQATDKLPYFSSATAMATTDLTTAGRAILDDASASDQRTTLGLAIGTNIQAYDQQLQDISALATTDSGFIVGNGSTFVLESGSTVRTSLGLSIGSDVQAWDQDLTTLSGMQSGASTEVASITSAEFDILDGLTATTTALNSVGASGNVLHKQSDGALDAASETKIPSSKCVATYVTNSLDAVGGFVTVATDAAFPATADQPDSGVVVSISDAGGMVVQDGTGGTTAGRSTTGRTTDGTPATVTVNSFPSTLYGETLADGVGLQVTSTGSSNTYTYQKILAKEADIIQLSNDINDFAARYRVSDTAPTSSLDEGDLWYDEDANSMKVYDGSSWTVVQSVGSFEIITLAASSVSAPAGSAASFNGTATTFKLTKPGGAAVTPSSAAQLIVNVGGVNQKANAGTNPSGLDGYVISGTDIIFCAAPAASEPYHIILIGTSVDVGTPSNNTVGLDQLEHATAGSILYWDASTVPQRLGPGTSGQFLKTQGAGAIPAWDNAAVLTGSTNNTICTVTGANAITGEANLTFDGSTLTLGGDLTFADSSAHDIQLQGGKIYGETAATGEFILQSTSGNSNHSKIVIGENYGSDNGGITFYGAGSSSADVKMRIRGTTDTVEIPDSHKLTLGNSSDLQVFHTGTYSEIKNTTGGLYLENTGEIGLIKGTYASGEWMVRAVYDGAVTLYHNGSARLSTTIDGVKITPGDDQADALKFVPADDTENTLIAWRNAADNATPGYIGYKYGDNYMSFRTNSNERFRIDSSGRILIGTTTGTSDPWGFNAHFQLNGDSTGAESTLSLARHSADTGAPVIVFGKSRAEGQTDTTLVQAGDKLGTIYFIGADGTGWEPSAAIEANVDGTPSDGTDMPGRISFWTCSDGSDQLAERVRITQGGELTQKATTQYTAPTAAFNINGGNATFADDAHIDLSSIANTGAIVALGSQRNGSNSIVYANALFYVSYGTSTITEISDPQGYFAPTDSDGSVCLYKGINTGTITVRNRIGHSNVISVAVIRTSGL